MASVTAGRSGHKQHSLTDQAGILNKNLNPDHCELSISRKTNEKMIQARRRQLKLFITVAFIFVTASYLPRPKWLTCDPEINPAPLKNHDLSFSYEERMPLKFIDPNLRGAVRMFNIYNETQTEIIRDYRHYKLSRREIDEHLPQVTPKLRVLPSTIKKLPIHLQLVSIREREYLFGKQGVKPSNQSTNSYSSRQQPECVKFVGPQEMKSPKICIHPPETDRVISMFLRSSGHWEIDHVIDMEWAMQANTDMQLVDLGCNLGVFTLYAAGMGRHVIAVDVLPSNLRLLQTSLTLNDLENQSYVIRRNTSDVYPKRNVTQAHPTTRPTARRTEKRSDVDTFFRPHHKIQNDIPKKDVGLDNVSIMDLNDAFYNKESLKETRHKRNRKARVRKSRALLQLKTDRVTKREAISHKIPLPVKSGSKIADDKFRTGISANSNKTESPDSHKLLKTPASSWSNPRNMSSNAPPTETLRISQLVTPPTETLRISQLVTIVHNAVYRDRTTRLGVHLQKDGNVGGSDVLGEDSPLLDEQRKSQSLVLVDTICLDDLLPLVKAPSVYLKMDIEGSEPQALQCAQKFFEKVRVRYVLMEWLFQLRAVGSSRSAAPAIIRFLTAKGLIPTRGTGVDVRGGAGDNRGVSVLDVNTWDKWPEMVLWMER